MGTKITPLIKGKIYHIFNKGNGNEVLFKEGKDYEHFLFLMEKYISLVAEVYAWVLMGNHFHLLVKIKEEYEIEYLHPLNGSKDENSLNKWKSISKNLDDTTYLKKTQPIKQFGHLFNAYAKYFNKKYKRTGSLFQKSFSRKAVYSKQYFKYMVYYIHHNPVHHGFVDDMVEYPWSSYLNIPSPNKSFLNKKEVMNWFDNMDNFIDFHASNHDFAKFKSLLFE